MSGGHVNKFLGEGALRIGIGINTGKVIVGTIGEGSKLELTLRLWFFDCPASLTGDCTI